VARVNGSVVQEMAAYRADSQPRDETSVHDRSIGSILSERKALSPERIEAILAHQREHGVRFGEAAIALGLATVDDVLWALSQQFHYPYAPQESRRLTPELIALNQPYSHQAEAFRVIRSQIAARLKADEGQHAIAVISPDAGDGKTFLAANLAVSHAQLGESTLLIDADMRGPRQHEVFGISNDAGLSAILSGRSVNKVIQQITHIPTLYVLPVGITPPNPLELIERPAFRMLMTELKSKFEHVIVDTPAAVYGSDASVIASRCGVALVVARRNASRISALQDLVSSVASAPGKLAGVIVNNF